MPTLAETTEQSSLPSLLTVDEAAALLRTSRRAIYEYAGVSRDTIYTACERRELQHARIGGRRSIRLKPAWIDEWLERHARVAHAWRTDGFSRADAEQRIVGSERRNDGSVQTLHAQGACA